MAKIEKEIYKIIGITAELEVIGVDHYFDYDTKKKDSFHGYTGTRYNFVTKKEVRHMNTLAYATEYITDAIPLKELKEKCGSIAKAAKIALCEKDGEYLGHDNSYFNKYGEQLDNLAKTQQNIFGCKPATFNCCGGGRMFGGYSSITHDTKWALLLEPALLAEILEVEKQFSPSGKDSQL